MKPHMVPDVTLIHVVYKRLTEQESQRDLRFYNQHKNWLDEFIRIIEL